MGAWEWEQGHLEAVSQLKYLSLLEHFNLVASFPVVPCFCFVFLLNIMQTKEHKWGRPGNEAKFWVPIKIIRFKAEMVSIVCVQLVP